MSRAQSIAPKITLQDQRRPSKQFIAELAVGMHVHAPFVLGSCESRIASNGSRYLAVTLRDKTGMMRGIQFDRMSYGDVPLPNTVVMVDGFVDGTRTSKRIKITSLSATSDYRSQDFVATSQRPIAEMSREFAQRVKALKSLPYASLIRRVYGNDGAYKQFIEAPLSQSGSLAYRGAALERTLKLCDVIDTLCNLYPHARRQLLLASALLAYIGAVDAFDVDAVISQSQRGKSLSLPVLAFQHIDKAIASHEMQRAGLAVESIILGSQESDKLVLEKALFSQACALLEQADLASEQDSASRIVAL